MEPLGEGGYGAVYLAEQISMDRQVAVKVIHPRVIQTNDFLERFEREARIASKLQHPNTVIYFDFGQDGDIPFLAMEFVKGRTLTAVIGDGSIPPVRTAHIARQICGSLGEAHELGMKAMVGCMTESTVGISAIAQLLPLVDYVDMDGAALLAKDIATGVVVDRGRCQYPEVDGNGVQLLEKK